MGFNAKYDTLMNECSCYVSQLRVKVPVCLFLWGMGRRQDSCYICNCSTHVILHLIFKGVFLCTYMCYTHMHFSFSVGFYLLKFWFQRKFYLCPQDLITKLTLHEDMLSHWISPAWPEIITARNQFVRFYFFCIQIPNNHFKDQLKITYKFNIISIIIFFLGLALE